MYRKGGCDLQPRVAVAATPGSKLLKVKAYERGRNPIGVEAELEFDTQGSRDGNPGLKVVTASRYQTSGKTPDIKPVYLASRFLPAFKLSKFRIALKTRK